MKILLWGINYSPESTGIAPYNAELAEYLAREGNDVSVVTGFPYYPHWRKAPGDRWRLYRSEVLQGVRVHRCGQYVPAKVTTAKRILHELSFGFASLLRVLFLPRADLYVVVSPPLFLGVCAWIATLFKRSRYVFHVQDLQPGAAVGLGMVKSRGFIRSLYALEAFAYKHAVAVSGISDGMLEEFRKKGVPATKRLFFPNWLRSSGGAAAMPLAGEFRRKFGLPAGDLLAVYSGNLGRKQGIDVLLEAAQRLAPTRASRLVAAGDRTNPVEAASDHPERAVTLVIAGAGAEREALAARVQTLALPNLRLLPLLSDEDYAGMLADADVGLITQAAGTGQFFFPSKFLSLLQAGLPVVTVADESSELARAVREGGFGINVEPGGVVELTAALRRLAEEPAVCSTLRQQATWVNRFSPEIVLPRFARQIEELAGEPRRTPEIAGQHEPSRL